MAAPLSIVGLDWAQGHEPSIADRAYRQLAALIRDRRLRGGDLIIETRLAAMLGISRTPLRQALQRLEGEGLIVRTTGRALVIRRVDLREYLQCLQAREIVEPEAAAMACGRVPAAEIARVRQQLTGLLSVRPYSAEAHWTLDGDLHELFISRCGNTPLIDVCRQLRTTTHMFEIARLHDRLSRDTTEHWAILDALDAADPQAARRALQVHLRSLYRFATDALE